MPYIGLIRSLEEADLKIPERIQEIFNDWIHTVKEDCYWRIRYGEIPGPVIR